jgi:hypothetical protein
VAEEKRTLEQLKKDQDSLVKKGKIVENSLKAAQQELENFQVCFFSMLDFYQRKLLNKISSNFRKKSKKRLTTWILW